MGLVVLFVADLEAVVESEEPSLVLAVLLLPLLHVLLEGLRGGGHSFLDRFGLNREVGARSGELAEEAHGITDGDLEKPRESLAKLPKEGRRRGDYVPVDGVATEIGRGGEARGRGGCNGSTAYEGVAIALIKTPVPPLVSALTAAMPKAKNMIMPITSGTEYLATNFLVVMRCWRAGSLSKYLPPV